MSDQGDSNNSLDQILFELLVCPACKTPVVQVEEFLLCRNPDCRRRYEILEGIPIMLVEESIVISIAEFGKLNLVTKD